MADRIFNFNAGPGVLPLSVLEEAQKDLINWKGKGLSIMEMSHRSKEFEGIIDQAFKDIKELLKIPNNYKVLFLQGGATGQFSAVPLNLMDGKRPADYVVTGQWSSKAYKEAKKYGKVNLVVDTTTTKPECTSVPPLDEWKLSEDASYLHLCVNETVHGVLMKEFPNVKCPIVADFSSCFMSEPIDVSKFGVIYAGAQKNVGPAGVVVVIIREDLLGHADPKTPTILDWKVHADENSLHHTPPCWSIYVMGLVFKWLKSIGGLEKMREINEKKAKIIYDVIDEDDFYSCPVSKNNRSLMNIRFNCKNGAKLEEEFLKGSEKLKMIGLKGYRTLGGIRASIYNAQSIENCEQLAKYMRDFKKENKK